MSSNRSSHLSTSSATTYPSTLSSHPPSSLGLTDSPSQLRKFHMTAPSTPGSDQPSRLHRSSRYQLRTAQSSSALGDRGLVKKLVKDAEQRATPRKNDIAIPRKRSALVESETRPTSRANNDISKSKPEAAQTGLKTTEDWETTLIQNAKNLRISTRSAGPDAEQQAERRKQDAEWEQAGKWDPQRDAAREAEDRTRRDAGREIAYPPSAPRVPIRAAPSGVTSVHVGVRPRLHPSRSEQSHYSNQPDMDLPLPLFSPTPNHASLHGNDRAEKARSEYETWLGKKAEREGGMGGVDGYGTRDWVPREREPARPAMARMASAEVNHVDEEIKTPAESVQYPYYDPTYGYWDPSMYWWGSPNPEQESKGGFEQDAGSPEAGGQQWHPMMQAGMNPYQWPMMGGMYNPYMANQMGMGQGQGQMPQMGQMSQMGQMPQMSQMQSQMQGTTHGQAELYRGSTPEELKPFDSSKMKQGRLGHYGYLEGRELAGPPPGYLPAGMQNQSVPSQHGSRNSNSVSPVPPSPTGASSAYYPPASVAGSQRSMWGDPGNLPRVRYDGANGPFT